MHIESGSFFILVAALAAGGGAGYFASQKHVFEPPPAPPPPKEPPAMTSAPVASVAPPVKPPAPVCDDGVGFPGTCPPPGYSADETGCGALPTKRCNDFTQAMKPRVAERAVACLNALSQAERCEPARLTLCGHLALMNACQEPDEADAEAGAAAAAGGLSAVCQAIFKECPLAPPRDCRATLSGMSELGRSKMATCMKSHCMDRGLLYCEAAMDVK